MGGGGRGGPFKRAGAAEKARAPALRETIGGKANTNKYFARQKSMQIDLKEKGGKGV